MFRRLSAAFFIAVFAILSPVAAQPKYEKPSDIPVEAFAALPSFSRPRLSPDGTALAYTVSQQGRRHIIYQNLDGTARGIIPPAENGEINRFFWANDRFLVIESLTNLHRIEFGKEIQNFTLYSFDRKKQKYVWLGKPTRLLKSKQRKQSHTFASQIERVVDRMPNDPDHILMELDFDLDGKPEVFKTNIKSGKRKLVQGEFRGIQDWYSDYTSEIRAGFGVDGTKQFALFKKPNGEFVGL